MSVMVSLWMFGKPGVELREGEEVTAEEIRALQQDLYQRLGRAAEIVERLTGAGWNAQMTLYEVMLTNPYVRTETEARTRLDDLGIDPQEVHIDEFEDEDDFEDECDLGDEAEFAEWDDEFDGEEFNGEEFGGPEEAEPQR